MTKVICSFLFYFCWNKGRGSWKANSTLVTNCTNSFFFFFSLFNYFLFSLQLIIYFFFFSPHRFSIKHLWFFWIWSNFSCFQKYLKAWAVCILLQKPGLIWFLKKKIKGDKLWIRVRHYHTLSLLLSLLKLNEVHSRNILLQGFFVIV